MSIESSPRGKKINTWRVLNVTTFYKVKTVLFIGWRRNLCNCHTGGGYETLIGAPGKSWAAECIRKGEKNRQLRVVELNESEELMKYH